MVEKHFVLSGASSVSDLRLMKPPRGRNVSLPFLSHICLDVLKKKKKKKGRKVYHTSTSLSSVQSCLTVRGSMLRRLQPTHGQGYWLFQKELLDMKRLRARLLKVASTSSEYVHHLVLFHRSSFAVAIRRVFVRIV